MSEAPLVRLVDAERFERRARFRLPFRFGVITVTEAIQTVVRARVAMPDGREVEGVAAESLAAKWFDKDPGLTDAQNLDHLRQAIDLALGLYRDAGARAPFELFASTYAEQLARGATLGQNRLVASFGPALLDRAILDAVGLALGLSFAEMIRRNVPGMRADPLAPDLAGFDLAAFLAGLAPGATIDVRHTVGLVDPLTAADRPAAERVDDGLPETLEEVVRRHRGRWYKLKVGGNLEADIERLSRIAAVLDRDAADYRCTLDGNEQYADVEGALALWRRMEETPALRRLCASTIFVEQPIKRQVALARPVDALARLKPVIIDESDDDLDAFPRAFALGYAGVSSKACKGLYKSLLNAARVAKLNAEAGRRRCFMSAEDLTTLAGASVQQDLALVSLIGLRHVERNGHHFVDGMSFAPAAEQRAFAAAHPRLYDATSGTARLRIERGALALDSLGCPGFAVGAAMDLDAMERGPASPAGAIVAAR